MFNLIYIIVGIYFLKVVILKIKQYAKSNKLNKSKINGVVLAKQKTNLKKFFKQSRKDKNSIFVFPYHKLEGSKENSKKDNNIILREEKQLALEKARYKCECCGNIANLDVYNENDNYIVLCKKCYEEKSTNINLHYE